MNYTMASFGMSSRRCTALFGSLILKRHPLLICNLNMLKLKVNRPFSSSDDGENRRIPNRIRKRLSKLNADGEKYEITFGDRSVNTSNESVPDKMETLLKDSLTGHDKSEAEFPSDVQSNKELKRLQSRKAFRPRTDPSLTSIVLFQGQGSQFVGMGEKLIPYPGVEDLYEEASAILGYDLLKLCLNGSKKELDKTVHCQPAILVTSLAALIKLRELHPEVDDTCVAAAGFSVGELAALVFAEALSFQDAVKLVKVRAEEMQRASEAVASGMMTAFCSHDTKLNFALHAAKEYCRVKLNMYNPVCTVANFLYPECKVIAGNSEALDFVQKNMKDFNIRRLKRLPVSGAFHTDLMKPAKSPFVSKLKEIELNNPRVPVYSNFSAGRYRFREGAGIVDLLGRQIYKPVKWEQIMHVVYSRDKGEEFPRTYEIGPGNQLGVMLKKVNAKAYSHLKNIEV